VNRPGAEGSREGGRQPAEDAKSHEDPGTATRPPSVREGDAARSFRAFYWRLPEIKKER
jgi:hypothetical protein